MPSPARHPEASNGKRHGRRHGKETKNHCSAKASGSPVKMFQLGCVERWEGRCVVKQADTTAGALRHGHEPSGSPGVSNAL